MKRGKVFLFSSIFTTALSAATTVFGIYVTNQLMYIKKKDDRFIYDREIKAQRFDEAWYKNCRKEEMLIDSPNGYQVKGVFLQPLDTKNTVIISHGVTENKLNSMKYARMYERLGFNTFVFDHRRHGESGGKTTSYGHYEKFDLQAVVQTVRSIIGDDAILGIHGESMGAATTLLYAGSIEDNADFYIADCAFSDFSKQVSHVIKKQTVLRTKLPVHLANIFLKLRDGYSIWDVSPKEAVSNIKSPILFVHSLQDDFILPEMSEEMYEVKKEPKMIKRFEKGAHAQSFNENPVEYEQTVKDFLEKYVYNKTNLQSVGDANSTD
ncbi:AB hydrolase-1 domain-containing protein OS=Ureibacillus acetophenoni OX=614649 GN=SAMN05877842_10453 PE=4 SV=1 [Ureibacillus acetophenoni]